MDRIERRSAALRRRMTFENLYGILFEDPKATAALYLDQNGFQHTRSYAECDERARAAAAMLRRELGDGLAGHYVALQLDTKPEWFVLFWAVILAGANALLLDPAAGDGITKHLLRQAGAIALIGEKERALKGNVRQLTAADLNAAPSAPDFTPAFGTAVALCTSGTTDTSRVFVYDESAVCSQLLNSELLHRLNRRIIDGEYTRNLAFLPSHHVFGFLVCMMWMAFIGGENVYLHDRSPQTVLVTARSFGITMLITVPILLNNLCAGLRRQLAAGDEGLRAQIGQGLQMSETAQRQDPDAGLQTAGQQLFPAVLGQLLGDQLRCVIVGGAFAPEANVKLFNDLGYYTVCGFGMTETGVTSVESAMDYAVRLSGSVGRPFDSAEYAVEQPGPDGAGELKIKGSTLHTGRLVDGRLLPPELDGDGFFHTGDLVRVDDAGRLYVKGRVKDLIINESGENVYPDEIEAAYIPPRSMDQYTVLGLSEDRTAAHPYEAISLVLHLQQDAEREDEKLTESVRELNRRLPAMKQVTRALVCAEPLPLSGSLKVKRRQLREQIEQGILPVEELALSAAPAQEKPRKAAKHKDRQTDPKVLETVRRLFAETLSLPINEIRDDAHFINDLNGDSLGIVSLTVKAEEHFGVTIEPKDYGECVTVRDAARLISRLMRGETAERKARGAVTPITRFEDTPEYKAFHERQERLMQGPDGNPYFVVHDSPLTDTSLMAGKRVLNFGSYNYVGMSGRRETMEAAKEAIEKYGTSASGSRLLAGEKTIHRQLEEAIAEWKHAESALVLVGGHSTNVTFVGNFCGKNDLILYDAIIHNSVMEDARLSEAEALPFPHNDAEALDKLLNLNRARYEKILIVVEGVYSMDGDIAPIPEYVRLKKKYGCFLMVDEAHSACVIGEHGGGVDEYFGLAPDDIDVKMGTLSKGLGTCGGYLAGKKSLIEYLRYSLPGFVFSVGISPPLAAATLRAVQLLKEDPTIMENMRRNIRVFTEEAHKRGFDTCLAGKTAIIPILVGTDEDAFLLSNRMRDKGVFVPPAVFPAVPRGKARLRFCVTSCHTPEEIIEALDKLQACALECGVDLPKWSGA